MGRPWPGIVGISMIWVIAISDGASMAAAELALEPPLQQPIEFTRETETTFFDREVGGAKVHAVRVDAREELLFTREAGVLRVRSRLLRSSQRVNGQESEDPLTRIVADHPLVMELDDHGQAQRAVNIASLVEPIQQSLLQTSGSQQPIPPALIETGILKVWNNIFGIPWAIIVGRPLKWGSMEQFKGTLQLGLPQYGPEVMAIEKTPVVGSVTVTEGKASDPGTVHARYTYSSEVALDEEARAQLKEALGNVGKVLTDGRWLSASITGTTEAVMERATLMFRALTITQELRVKGEVGASFRVERTVKIQR